MSFAKINMVVLILMVAMSGFIVNPALAHDKASQTRNLSGFTEILAKGSGDVDVKIGDSFKVEVSGHAEDFEHISTEIEDGVLVIGSFPDNGRSNWRFKHGYVVTITMPKLDALYSRGSGDGRIVNLSANQFKLEQRGSGDVQISGTCTEGTFNSSGSGDLEARGLACGIVEINSRGSGDVTMTVNGAVSLDLNGSGDVDLYGSPRITHMSSRGSGDVSIID